MMENDSNRDSTGRFTIGNKAAKGNPYTRKAAEYRKAMYGSVTAKDMRQIIETLKEQAISGDLKAICILLDRLLGSPKEAGIDILERLEKAESVLEDENGNHQD